MLRRFAPGLFVLVLPMLAGLDGVPARAQTAPEKPEPIKFLDTTVQPLAGTYLVLTNANVRAEPRTKGKRLGRRDKGDRVTVVGRAKGPWLAIRDDDGKDAGFIYQPSLMPVIDGSIDKTLSGSLTGSGKAACRYEIRFEGKSQAQGQAFEFADYDIGWNCSIGGSLMPFHTPMFLTEGPYRGKAKSIHQITIDILDLTLGVENVLSTHMLWDRDKGVVTFDSITIKQYGRNPNPAEAPAAELPMALQAAVQIAASAWNTQLWRAVASSTKETEDD